MAAEEASNVTAMLRTVLSSSLWSRIRSAKKRFSEIPFVPKADGRPPRTVSGVIDLVFLEPGGWAIIDYKSDIVNDNFDKLIAYHSAQVNMYRKF